MAIRSNTFKTKRLVLGVASALMLSASQVINAAEIEIFKLDVSESIAGKALLELAEKSGAQIIFSQEIGKKFRTAKVNGEYTLESALSAMLRNSGLVYEFLSEDSVVIKEQDDENSQNQAIEEVEEVVVTGTRLKNISTGSFTQSITKADIKRLGIGSVEDLLRYIPQNNNSVNSATTLDPDRVSRLSQGETAFDLRGLGSGSTLVLVNGRRYAQSATFQNGTVNLNGIPFAAIERVDIVLDGASAIYGADAQAGVVNFILSKDYVGSETSIRYENSAHDGDNYQLEQLIGTNWGSGHAMLTLNHRNTDGMNTRKAGYVTDDHRPRGGSDNRVSAFGQPGVISGLDIKRLFTTGSAAFVKFGALPQDDDGTNGLSELSPDNIIPVDTQAELAKSGTTETEITSYRFSGSQELTDRVEVFAETNFTRTESQSAASFPLLFVTGSLFTQSPYYTDLPDSLQEQYDYLASRFLPASIFERSLLLGYLPVSEYTEGGASRPPVTTESKMEVATLGFNVDLTDSWSAEISYTDTKTDSTYFSQSAVMSRVFDAALSGDINLFGNGSANDPAEIDALFPTMEEALSGVSFTTESWDVSANGTLFSLPGGDVALATGIEMRDEEVDVGEWFDEANDSDGQSELSREVESAYVELGIPLINEGNSLPWVRSLDLKLAARYDGYDFTGRFKIGGPTETRSFSNTSPKVDLSWYVTDDFKFRASWGESFQVPTLSRMFRAFDESEDIATILNPFTNNVDAYIRIFKNNPNIEPELSDNISIGFDWIPSGSMEGLSLSVNYSDINIDGRFDSGDNALKTDPLGYLSVPGTAIFNADGSLNTIYVYGTVNIAEHSSKAWDFTVIYDFDTDLGAFRVGTGGTYTSEVVQKFSAVGEPQYIDATTFGPDRLKVSSYLNWSDGDMSATMQYNYSSSYSGRVAPQDGKKIRSYWTLDLNGTYSFADTGWKVNAGVRNLLNNRFPFLNNYGGPDWDPSRVDPRGRAIYAEVTKAFTF
ncbi:TonB-dependent receptor [Porticoccaceae bacterium LTM1]|nr:TonB-dependent receptor [Porticoccaceae bacterium LTM1]